MKNAEYNNKLFGTDGIRGRANQGYITPESFARLALCASIQFISGGHRHRVIIGKDTRLSGYMLEPALVSGFISAGIDVVTVGPLPTPAIAMLTRTMRADFGVMISASHNPYQDNGIKLFTPTGHKLSHLVENRIAMLMEQPDRINYVDSESLGRAVRMEDAQGRYIEFAKSTLDPNIRLDGLRIVVDCAHGAAYKVAPTVLYELGAEVISLSIAPNGTNINDACGALHPNQICDAVKEYNADIGIALDGDADRLVVCDAQGNVIHGDILMAILIKDWHQREQLRGPVVSTIMANYAFQNFVENLGIRFLRTKVGDRNVMSEMIRHRSNFGGESSGHIIFMDYNFTGDGLVAALQVLRSMAYTQKPLHELAKLFTPTPQQNETINLQTNIDLEALDAYHKIIQNSQRQLNKKGRLVVRRSGTENVLRLMIESQDTQLMNTVIHELKQKIIDLVQQLSA